ncbi:MAG: hypothetical protein RMJ52_03165 [Gemmataceae bacterium]|nr:hypothetical protein [Gemmataceae bacterium]
MPATDDKATTVTLPPPDLAKGDGGLSFRLPKPIDEPESIFGEVMDDDLFGRSGKPVLELPPAPPNLQLQETNFEVPPMRPSAPYPDLFAPPNAPPAYSSPFAGPQETDPQATVPMEPEAPSAPTAPGDGWAGTSPEAAEELPPLAKPGASIRRQERTNPMVLMLVVILVPYSIFSTGVAIYSYYRLQQVPHPLEMVPDIISDFRDTTQRGKPQSRVIDRVPPLTPLPDKLKVALGQTLRIGDLEITPEKVEQRRVVFHYRNRPFKPEPADEDSIVLHVRLKNVSEDVRFRPTDPAFEGHWTEGMSRNSRPYMFMEVGDKRFYGGPFPWSPTNRRVIKGDEPEKLYVDGQEDHERILAPGEEMRTVFATDPKDHVPEYIEGFKGNITWRLQLRRGFVRYKDRDIPTTAVIGVVFNPKDIVRN